MKFYDHHIGDYDTLAGHLTACEDGIFSRLIRKYLSTEKPLPADIEQVKRLARARTREEKNAVADVLSEFFSLQADGWHREELDAVISRYQRGEPEREAKKANEETRLQRHRQERSDLFSMLNAAGIHAPWDTKMSDLRAMTERCRNAPPETKPETLQVPATATPRTANHLPLTTDQSPTGINTSTTDVVVVPPASPAGPAAPAKSKKSKPKREPGERHPDDAPEDEDQADTPVDVHAGLLPRCPQRKVRDLWATLLPDMPQHVQWNETRQTALRVRWKEAAREKGWKTEQDGLSYFSKLFRYIGTSHFLTGRTPPAPGRQQFLVTLEWVLKSGNMAKIIDGNYHAE